MSTRLKCWQLNCSLTNISLISLLVISLRFSGRTTGLVDHDYVVAPDYSKFLFGVPLFFLFLRARSSCMDEFELFWFLLMPFMPMELSMLDLMFVSVLFFTRVCEPLIIGLNFTLLYGLLSCRLSLPLFGFISICLWMNSFIFRGELSSSPSILI